MNRLVLLDNEAVQSLRDPAHRKHLQVISQILTANTRKVQGRSVQTAVPGAVRVEAGWDRTAATWAFANQLRIADIPLDREQADSAASIRKRTQVSVADAHLGAAIQAATGNVTVITSDPRDIHRVAEGRRVDIVAI